MPYNKQNMPIFFHLGAHATAVLQQHWHCTVSVCASSYLTNSNSRVLFEKLAVTHLVTKLTYFYGTRALRRAAVPNTKAGRCKEH